MPPIRGRIRRLVTGASTIEEVVASTGRAVRPALRKAFSEGGLDYPPREAAFVAIKDEKRLEVWCSADGGSWTHVKTHPILAASGTAGPKLKEGDRQVPEGIYRVLGLNPNSSYHLSMKLDYPNAFDHEMARKEGRTDLGGDIFIHGRAASIGCLAMGDPAIEELFLLAHDAGIRNIRVIIAPYDFRKRSETTEIPPGAPKWVPELYRRIRRAMVPFTTPSPGR